MTHKGEVKPLTHYEHRRLTGLHFLCVYGRWGRRELEGRTNDRDLEDGGGLTEPHFPLKLTTASSSPSTKTIYSFQPR